jgi:hypothetical protein
METQNNNNNKKTWSKPTVLALDINKDTYTSQGQGEREVGSGVGQNQYKNIPS